MTSPFRERPVVVPLFGPPAREKGEARRTCPACAAALTKDTYGTYQDGDRIIRKKIGWDFSHSVSRGIFCGPGQRLRTGPWWWPRRCKEPGQHLHQACWSCGAKWIRDCVGVL